MLVFVLEFVLVFVCVLVVWFDVRVDWHDIGELVCMRLERLDD